MFSVLKAELRDWDLREIAVSDLLTHASCLPCMLCRLRGRMYRETGLVGLERGFGNRMENVRAWAAAKSLAVISIALLGHAALCTQPDMSSSVQPLTVLDVVRNLQERNRARAQALHGFEGTRVYTLHYRGFPHNYDAEIVVKISYQAPSNKEFTVVAQSGPKFIVDRVLKKMLESETEAGNDQIRSALSEQNYDFTLTGYEQTPEGTRYILAVIPKSKNKFLYRGKVWIDAADFAVVKIEAQPVQNPSFWIKKTDIRHVYKKVDDFWLPAENHSQSFMRIGGHADLVIEYKDYKITAADPVSAPPNLGHDATPKPVSSE